MSEQLNEWTGEFGVAYTDRNRPNWRTLVPAWEQITKTLRGDRAPVSVLEVGCNLGHNLHALAQIYPGARLIGVEPQTYARGYAQAMGLTVHEGHIPGDLPVGSVDLVFTSGVLIHIAGEVLDDAIRTLHSAARRWLVAVEYFAEQDEEIEYRGMPRQLWRRDYGAHYERLFPKLTRLAFGEVTDGEGFDRCHFWVFEKP